MTKGRFLICGLGNFGANVAMKLFEKDNEVIAVDVDEKKVRDAKDYVSEAIVADVSVKETLNQLNLINIDAAVISLGESRIDASILSTLLLKDLGIKKIIVKVISEEHARIVEKIGATEIVFPEQEAGLRLAERLCNPNLFDQIRLPENYTLAQLLAPKELQGKSLKDAQIRTNYGITVVLITRKKPGGEEISIVPTPDDYVYDGDTLFVLGEHVFVEKFEGLKV